jgi:hypothetical protein
MASGSNFLSMIPVISSIADMVEAEILIMILRKKDYTGEKNFIETVDIWLNIH